MRRVAAAALALMLAGCAGLTSTLPAAIPAASFVGTGAQAVPLAALDDELARLQSQLERVASRGGPVPMQLSRSPDAYLRVRLGADESFVPASAQLQASALMLYAEIGEVVRSSPAAVLHVVVHGDVPAEDAAADLTARRAASVQSYLLTRGIPATRVRAEGRANREPATVEPGAEAANRRVDLVLRPVVAGSEAVAWMPPPSLGCLPCAAP
jgi:outer membrane protein OmpA-like peptidoglycan-associated protein